MQAVIASWELLLWDKLDFSVESLQKSIIIWLFHFGGLQTRPKTFFIYFVSFSLIKESELFIICYETLKFVIVILVEGFDLNRC